MNREILFRGKRIDNGKWVEGDIHKNLDFSKAHIHPIGERVRSFDVIPETVGQYTGLCDKNGVKIFEGDIVSLVDCDIQYKGLVYWCSESYWIDCSKSDNEEDEDFFTLFYAHTRNAKVIGNIHDNPELLKGEEND